MSDLVEGGAIVSALFFHQLGLIALVWLCRMRHWTWPSTHAAVRPTTPEPPPRGPKPNRALNPFASLTTKPHCDAWAHAGEPRPHTPSAPPPRLIMTRRCRRQVDTAIPFCPNLACTSR